MTEREVLLREISAFLKARNMSDSSFGRLAVNDGKFVARIRRGGDLTTQTLARVRAFMQAEKVREAKEAQRLTRLVAAG